MAEYRTIKMAFWGDPFVESLNPETKLLYLYLFTNANTNALGVSDISRRKIAFETGMGQQSVDEGLETLRCAGKIVIDGESILLVHFIRHQFSASPKITQLLKSLFAQTSSHIIKQELCKRYPGLFECKNTVSDNSDTLSIPYGYPTDTLNLTKQDLTKQDINNLSPYNPSPLPESVPPTESEEGERENFSPDELPTEFIELRDYYDEHCRPEPPVAGFKEYKAIRMTKLWPGILRIYDDIDKRLEAKHYDKGYWPGLGKYLNQSTWRGAIVPRGEKPAANDWTVSETSWERAAREKAQKELDQQKKNNKTPDNESSIGTIWDGMKGKYKVGNGEGD